MCKQNMQRQRKPNSPEQSSTGSFLGGVWNHNGIGANNVRHRRPAGAQAARGGQPPPLEACEQGDVVTRGDIEHAGGPERGAPAEGLEAMCPGARPPPPPSPPRGGDPGEEEEEAAAGNHHRAPRRRVSRGAARPGAGGAASRAQKARQHGGDPARDLPARLPAVRPVPGAPGPASPLAARPPHPRPKARSRPASSLTPAPGYLTAGGGPRPGAVRMRGPRPARPPRGALKRQCSRGSTASRETRAFSAGVAGPRAEGAGTGRVCPPPPSGPGPASSAVARRPPLGSEESGGQRLFQGAGGAGTPGRGRPENREVGGWAGAEPRGREGRELGRGRDAPPPGSGAPGARQVRPSGLSPCCSRRPGALPAGGGGGVLSPRASSRGALLLEATLATGM
ncbi:Triple Functional Domain Protein [Manis pentadactyla]|nr:Triple Functional Domain Protein [Manis pentadactyla]